MSWEGEPDGYKVTVTGFHKVRSQIVSANAMMAFDGG
jgi:hypothetical protein